MMSTARRSLLRIQYASDLHLEILGSVPFPSILKPIAPVLALAGDIGNPTTPDYQNFLKYCSSNWDHVVLVAGNHEFYNKKPAGKWYAPSTVPERLQACRDVAASFQNVRFLERERVDISGVAFLGCTLWTDLSDPAAASEAESRMNDYRLIAAEKNRVLRAADVTESHARDRAWLDREIAIAAEEEQPVVVLTHHLPSFDLIAAKYKGAGLLNHAFASDCHSLIRRPVRAWIAGHTHTAATRIWPPGIQGLVNPMGYPGEVETGYCREIFVDVSTEAVSGSTADPMLVEAAQEESGRAPVPRMTAEQEQNLEWV
jgi:hypothetical protein